MTDNVASDIATLGNYGQMAMKYMQEYHPARLSQIIVAGQMTRVFQEVNQEANEMLAFLTEHAEKELRLPDTATDGEKNEQKKLIFELCEAAVIGEVVNRKR
jgi:hypothetical protein